RGHGELGAETGAVQGEVEGAALAAGGDAHIQGVGTAGLDIDRVVQPFAGLGPAHVVAGVGVGSGFDVHAIRAVLAAAIYGVRIVVGHAFPAFVVVLRLDGAGDGVGRAGIGSGAAG